MKCSVSTTTSEPLTFNIMTSPNLVQETNIENILETHLWNEIDAIRNRILKLQEEIGQLSSREEKLLNIATAAGIEPPLEKMP